MKCDCCYGEASRLHLVYTGCPSQAYERYCTPCWEPLKEDIKNTTVPKIQAILDAYEDTAGHPYYRAGDLEDIRYVKGWYPLRIGNLGLRRGLVGFPFEGAIIEVSISNPEAAQKIIQEEQRIREGMVQDYHNLCHAFSHSCEG
jgi:hypothetical protein